MMDRKSSILANAAKISPQVRGPTIGPNAADLEALSEGFGDLTITRNAKDSPKVLEKNGDDDFTEGSLRMSINLKEYFEDMSCLRKMQHLEKLRKIAVQKDVQTRLSRQRMQQSDLEAIYGEAQRNLQRKLAMQCEEAERRVKQAIEEQEKLSRIQEEKMREAMVANSKRVDSQQLKLKQFREKQKMNSCIEALRRGQEKFVKCFETFARTLMSIEKVQLPNYMALNEKAKPMMTTYEQTIKSIADGNITEAAVKVIEGLVEDFQKLQHELVTQIAEDAKEAERKIQQEVPQVPKVVAAVDQTDTVHNVQGLNQFISPDSQKHYTKVMDLLIGYSRAIEPLSRDEALKKFRFNCQKAINIPVNAISAVSSAHLRDKYDKLASLLSGNPTPCGDEQINAGAHPIGMKFCTVLLAKKFVNQGDTMVASNPKAAFPIAAVIVALWQKFPDFGDLFLAHAYRECPYLVPYFIPQFEGQSTEEYCRALGYKTTNGAQEPQDMYLKRMAGIARLYAAVLIAKSRSGESQSNPHSLENGWMWLCNVLNMDPLPDICATVLLEMLQIVGEEMIRVYGRQFLKLISVIQNQYLPKLKLVDEGGPRVRLEVMLAKLINEGKFDKPEGILDANFW